MPPPLSLMSTSPNRTMDMEILKRYTLGKTSLMRTLLTTFAEELPKSVDQMRQSFSREDWKDLGAQCHKILSSCALVGCLELETKILSLQKSTQVPRKDHIAKMLTEIESFSRKVEQDIVLVLESLEADRTATKS